MRALRRPLLALALLTLFTPTLAADTSTGAVELLVTGGEGVPLDRAEIQASLIQDGLQMVGGVGVPAVTTGEDGRATLELAEGRWSLMVRAPGHFPETAGPVVITAGETGRIEVALRPAAVTDVTVRVLGPPTDGGSEDQPIALADVRLSTVRGEPRYHRAVPTGDDGWVLFGAVPSGTYRLFVQHPLYPALSIRDQRITLDTDEITVRLEAPPGGWAPVSGRVVRAGDGVPQVTVSLRSEGSTRSYHRDALTGNDGAFAIDAVPLGVYRVIWRPDVSSGYPERHRPEPLTVDAAGVRDLVLSMPPGVHVHGPIENLGAVPREHLGVSAASLPADGLPQTWAGGEIDPDAHYHFRELPPGTWEITVRAGGRQAKRRVEVPASGVGDDGIERSIALPAGHDVPGVVTLRGEPMVGARVGLSSTEPEDPSGYGAGEPTGADGRFVIRGVPPGEYDLGVSRDDAGVLHRERIEVAAGSELTVDVRPASVTGRVVDARTGEPISGARLQLGYHGPDAVISHTHPSWVAVAGDGTFEAAPLEPGEWSFRATAGGYSPSRQRLDLMDDGRGRAIEDLVVEMAPTAGLLVHVTMKNGEVPARVELLLFHPDWERRNREEPGSGLAVKHSDRPGDDPEVFWPDAPAGRWVLEARTGGGGTTSLDVEIPERIAAEPVRVVLSDIGSLAARVEDLAGAENAAPAAEAHLSLESTEGIVLGDDCRCWRGKRGYFYARNVPPGRYLATVTAADGRAWSADVEIEPGERAVAELDASGSE